MIRTGDDHVARDLVPSPTPCPEIEHLVQVAVGEQRRDHRTLPGSRLADYTRPRPRGPAFSYFRMRRGDAPVADLVLHEANKPGLAVSTSAQMSAVVADEGLQHAARQSGIEGIVVHDKLPSSRNDLESLPKLCAAGASPTAAASAVYRLLATTLKPVCT